MEIFSAKFPRVHINIFDKLVNAYSNTRHASIKMTPIQANKEDNENEVWRNLYLYHYKIIKIDAKLSVGDTVRISKKKGF